MGEYGTQSLASCRGVAVSTEHPTREGSRHCHDPGEPWEFLLFGSGKAVTDAGATGRWDGSDLALEWM